MRNLNECQAEVFRRSEKRIRERKQRRSRILMACIPLVLGITLFSTFSLLEETKDLGFDGGITGNMSESMVCTYVKVDVTGSGVSRTYTKASDVLNISNQLNSYMVNGPGNSQSVGEETRGEGFQDGTVEDIYIGTTGTTPSTAGEYVITLTLREGSTVVYRLTGNGLLDLTENQTYKLTREQLKGLNELLGIQ